MLKAIGLLLFFCSTAVAGSIMNGNFESEGTWTYRSGWNRTCNTSHRGNCSAEFSGYAGTRTPIAYQFFRMDQKERCEISAWIKTDLASPAFNSDKSPTRSGVSIQVWNLVTGRKIAIDLGLRNLYKEGCRGQCGVVNWKEYAGSFETEPGLWKVTLYAHTLRDKAGKVEGQLKGRAWVDDIVMK
jgi:hypothetical protein